MKKDSKSHYGKATKEGIDEVADILEKVKNEDKFAYKHFIKIARIIKRINKYERYNKQPYYDFCYQKKDNYYF